MRTTAWAVAGTSFLWLYAPVLSRLADDWVHDENYSHGFLIIPLALYFAWERRGRLTQAAQPGITGFLIVLFGLALFAGGLLGAELSLTRLSLIVVLAGSLVFLCGWHGLRVFGFPIAFLLLMMPIPAIVFNEIAFPLQLLASRAGEVTLSALSIPVLREGNIIVLAHTTLEVAEACSGIRSLMTLLTLGIVYGYFIDSRTSVRLMVALSTVPIAIVTNGARVAGTGVAAHQFGVEAAEGFFHTFSGWIVFLSAFVTLLGVTALIRKVTPEPPRVDGLTTALERA